MKRLRFPSGAGNGSVIIPSGQILTVSMVPHATLGSYLVIAGSNPIFVPASAQLALDAHAFGYCCSVDTCDMYPGNVQIELLFNDVGDGSVPAAGEPQSWLVVYNGC